MRGSLLVVIAGAAFLLAQAGCGSTKELDRAQAAVEATKSRGELYGLPAMRRARFHRSRGGQAMERAYVARTLSEREAYFEKAEQDLFTATDSYQAALTEAPSAYHPVIEEELQIVAGFLIQIQRDRAPSWGP